MVVQNIACASCGAPISVPESVDFLNCAFCGASLQVDRGEGYVALKLGEQVSQAITDSGERTRSSIQDGTQVTQSELKRLQVTQEISGLQIQLSTLQSEIRSLERQKQNRKTKKQVKELYKQESGLIQRIKILQTSLQPAGRLQIPIQPVKSKPAGGGLLRSLPVRGCFTGCAVLMGVGLVCGLIAMPIDSALFGITTEGEGSGPIYSAAMVTSMIAGLVAFVYVLNPDAGVWKSIRSKFPRRKETKSSTD